MTTVVTDSNAAPANDDFWDQTEDLFARRRVLFRNLISAAILIACGVAVLWVLNPQLLLTNTTTAGGDTGAHVWWPAFLRDYLLPSGRLSGWSKDYYAGFPAGQFYFPIPALMVVILNVVLPYNIAFKLVTASGALFLPASAYVLGRGLKVRFPGPAFMGVATLGLLFFAGDPRAGQPYSTAAFNQRIMGGTLASTLAGEFSFTIALCFALCFIGVFAMTLRGNKRPGWAALLLAAVVLSHLVVGIFVGIAALVVLAFRFFADDRRKQGIAVGALILVTLLVATLTISVWAILPFALAAVGAVAWFWRGDRNRLVLIAAGIGGTGFLLSAVWTLPLLARFPYTSNMRYEKLVDHVFDLYLFPIYGWNQLFPLVFFLGVIGIAVGIALWRPATILLATMTALMGVLFVQWPEAHAWNLRFLPFWYLGWMLLAGIGAAEIVRVPAALLSPAGDAAMPVTVAEPGPVAVALFEPSSADSLAEARPSNNTMLRVIAFTLTACLALAFGVFVPRVAYAGKGFLDFWAEYNYTGYEWAKTSVVPPGGARTASAKAPCNIPVKSGDYERSAKSYPEYARIMRTMEALPPGRALWEPSSSIDKYGTTLALELLPYCTQGRIGSMEGLYFEAAGTTAYHFITVSELAQQPSNPMRFPKIATPYGTLADFQLGVRHLQNLGVRYYMAQSTEAKQKADVDPALKLVAEVPDVDNASPSGWKIYEVANAPLVEPLRYAPVVASDVSPSDWQQSGAKWLTDWFNDPNALDRPIVQSGPVQWTRAKAVDAAAVPFGDQLPQVEVTNVRETQDTVSFDVSQPGVPVYVKTSYYPAWKVSGAKGPYRASPNFMVVVPTSNHVELRFARTGVDYLGILATLIGLGLLVPLFMWVPRPAFRRAAGDDDTEDASGDGASGSDARVDRDEGATSADAVSDVVSEPEANAASNESPAADDTSA
jgi:hypothetical protein